MIGKIEHKALRGFHAAHKKWFGKPTINTKRKDSKIGEQPAQPYQHASRVIYNIQENHKDTDTSM